MAAPAGGGEPLPQTNPFPPLVGARLENKQPKALSYAAVTKTKGERRFPPIQLAARQYGSKDGKPSIPFTTAELQVGIDNLKHSLVAKFSGGRPPIEEVRRAFLETWALQGPCSIGAWDSRHILIVLESETDARKVLAHPLRKLGHSYFRVFRWSIDFDTKKEPTTTTTWVRLINLPPQMFNQGYVESIVASFGRFLAIDTKTASFSNPSFARVCIELDVSKNPPDEVWIATGPQFGFWLKLLFENKLLYCTKCHLHGHHLETCRKVKQRREEEQLVWEAREDLNKDGTSTREDKMVQSVSKLGQSDKLVQSVSKPVPITSMEPGYTPSEDETQEWKLVQMKKQMKKDVKHLSNKSATQTDQRKKWGMDIVPQSMPNVACSLLSSSVVVETRQRTTTKEALEDGQDKVHPTAAIAGPFLSATAPPLLTHADKDNMSSKDHPTALAGLVLQNTSPYQRDTTPTLVKAPINLNKALPPLTIFRRARGPRQRQTQWG